jgi:hypothetical protein
MSPRVVERFGGFEIGADAQGREEGRKAIERRRVFFEPNGISARQVQADALDLPSELLRSEPRPELRECARSPLT